MMRILMKQNNISLQFFKQTLTWMVWAAMLFALWSCSSIGKEGFLNFDVNAPVFANCPADLSTTTGDISVGNVAVSWDVITASDDSGEVPTISSSHNNGTDFPVGTTTVVVRAEDQAGNVSLCEFDVIVIRGADVNAPVFANCPVIITEPSLDQSTVSVTWEVIIVSDDSGEVPTISSSHNNGTDFPVGTTTVAVRAEDQAGNVSLCEFDVIVIRGADVNPPVFANCPAELSATTTDISADSMAVSWDVITASDDSGEVPTISSSHNNGTDFPVGTTTVAVRAEDPAGNTSLCEFDVIVIRGADVNAPVFANCPAELSATTTDISADSMAVSWDVITASDDSGEVPTISSSHNNGTDFPVGTTTVAVRAEDPAGNTSLCEFDVIVIRGADVNAPVFANCPAELSATTTDISADSMAVSWDVITASDDSGEVPTISSSHNNGTDFPVGTTTVAVRAEDQAGNVSLCEFDVIVTEQYFATAGGDGIPGTTENPFILSARDMANLSDVINQNEVYSVNGKKYNYRSGAYRLSEDIAFPAPIASEQSNFSPIGLEKLAFKGVFDGNNKTISGLRYNKESRYVGFFGYLSNASVFDLNFKDCIIISDGYRIGTLAGYAYKTTISNVHVTNGKVIGQEDVGALIGTIYLTGVLESSAIGDVEGEEDVGGLLGKAILSSLHNTFFKGTVRGTIKYAGGLVGKNDGLVFHSYAQADVAGNKYVGGLLGYSGKKGAIKASYASGEVSGKEDVGGLIGKNLGTVEASYAMVEIVANSDGELIGVGLIEDSNNKNRAITSYWNEDLWTGETINGTGKTGEELRSQLSYDLIYETWNADFDEDGLGDDPWDFGTSSMYPVLKNHIIPVHEQRSQLP